MQAVTKHFFDLPSSQKLKASVMLELSLFSVTALLPLLVPATAQVPSPSLGLFTLPSPCSVAQGIPVLLQVKRTESNPNGFFNDELTKQVQERAGL